MLFGSRARRGTAILSHARNRSRGCNSRVISYSYTLAFNFDFNPISHSSSCQAPRDSSVLFVFYLSLSSRKVPVRERSRTVRAPAPIGGFN